MYLYHRCTSDRSCPRGFICHTDGACQYPCEDYSECLKTEYCHQEEKICLVSCTKNEQCGKDFTCLDGACYRSCPTIKKTLQFRSANEDKNSSTVNEDIFDDFSNNDGPTTINPANETENNRRKRALTDSTTAETTITTLTTQITTTVTVIGLSGRSLTRETPDCLNNQNCQK